MAKEIFELRDQENLATYAYLQSLDGKLVFLCNSIGYGLPYSTQYTNPEKIADRYQAGYAILPQADPNGLFSSSSTAATWVMCIDPDTNKARPVYVESNVTIAHFKLK